MKILNSSIHGIVDYLVVIFLVLSPSIFALSETGAQYCYILAGVHLGLTILTNFKYGIIKVIPFPVHGIIEYIVGAALIISPFILNYDGVDKTFYIGFGIAVLVTALVTNYKS